jgi:ABC-type nitrate/sulfonate/bicarbonate transport system permease component
MKTEGLGRKATWALRALSVLTILIAWELYGRSSNPLLFTYPTAVADAGVDMVADGTLVRALGQSLSVLAMGFAIGTGAGIALGMLAGRSAVAAALLELPVNALYATPMVALIPVLVLWFGFGVTAKVVVVTLFVVFPVLINTMRGVREVDQRLVEVARTFRSSERKLWLDLVLPSSLPFIVTGIRLAIGRGLIGIIVAEFYTAFSGLGYLIVDNANTFKTARVFVPIVVLMALGVTLTALLEWAEGRIAPWQKATR